MSSDMMDQLAKKKDKSSFEVNIFWSFIVSTAVTVFISFAKEGSFLLYKAYYNMAQLCGSSLLKRNMAVK